MKQLPIIIVGGGIGGLSAAVLLAAKGLPVSLFESSATVGGKIRQLSVGGHAIDSGPTVLTMRSVFENLFTSADANFHDYVATRPLEVLARHAWSANSHLDLYQDQARSVAAIGDFAGASEARRYQDFCLHTEKIFNTLESSFIKDRRPNPLELVLRSGLRGVPGLLAMKPFASMWQELSKQLRNPQLQQLFARYATYCGSSPYLAPAVLMLIAHVEQRGVWSVDGGMQNLALGCQQLAHAKGCDIHLSTTIKKIELSNGKASGVVTQDGEQYPASAIIFNGDPSALADHLLGDAVAGASRKTKAQQRSLSAVTFSFTAATTGFALDRHNVFFSADYRKEFDEIFKLNRLPSDPTVYLCAQNRGTASNLNTTSDAEPLFCLVNAPASADTAALRPEQRQQCQQSAFERMRQCGLQIESMSEEIVVTTPSDFHELFPGTGGALYGQASHHWRASFSRPGSSTPIKGLYLAGGATHPGPGVPMASLSGQLAAAKVMEDLGV